MSRPAQRSEGAVAFFFDGDSCISLIVDTCFSIKPKNNRIKQKYSTNLKDLLNISQMLHRHPLLPLLSVLKTANELAS